MILLHRGEAAWPRPEYPRPELPLPHVQGVADVEKSLLPVQLILVQCFRPRLPPEAVNFLTVHTNDVAQIAVPTENRAEHVVKFVERHLIGDRNQADDHRAHLAQNRSQNQAFEGGCFNHLSIVLGSPDPQLFGTLDPTLNNNVFHVLYSANANIKITKVLLIGIATYYLLNYSVRSALRGAADESA